MIPEHHGLTERLDEAAAATRVLVAFDFDGTLSDIVSDPAQARARATTADLVHRLSRLPETLVAIVSGRSLDDLRAVAADLAESGRVRLFGSHGLEADDGTAVGLPRAASLGRDTLVRRARDIVHGVERARVEEKPYGAAIHLRAVTAAGATRVLRDVERLVDTHPGLFVKSGKQVVELSVLPLHKGYAIDTLQHRWVPDVTVYAGDDVTDEDIFTSLWPQDIGIKVGEGATAADYRTEDPESLERLLERFFALRMQVVGSTLPA